MKYAIDAVAGQLGSQLISLSALGGTFLVYGLLSGKPIELDVVTAIFKVGLPFILLYAKYLWL